MSPTARRARALVAALATLAALAPATGAAARSKPDIDVQGHGTADTSEWWWTRVAGDVEGRPFSGAYRGSISPDQGLFPEAGECTGGFASVTLLGSGPRSVWMIGVGEICGLHVDATNQVRHVFTGQFDTGAAQPQHLVGVQGFLEVRVGADGSSHLTVRSS